MNWWVTSFIESRGAGYLIAWCFWVVFSIVLHELAHGFTAIRCGDRTPIETGHMTWNPLVHIPVPGLIAFALVGLTWGLMPVNPSRFRGRFDDAKVAIAGPLTNSWIDAIALLCAGAMLALDFRGVLDLTRGNWQGNLFEFLYLGAVLNMVLVALNLLPIPPLDGSRILANFSRRYSDFIAQPQVAQGSFIAVALILIFGGKYAYRYAADAAGYLIAQLAGAFA